MERRDFIKKTSIAGAGLTVLTFPVFGKNAPSNKVILASVGVNSRGAYLAACYSRLPNVEIAYICDVEDSAIKNGFDAVKNASRKPTLIRDVRELVKKNDFDAILVATPDHWHAPAAILGVTHGKHVYVEKPCGHNPAEGEMLAAAMHRHGKLIQMGNQRRSMPTMMQAAKEIKDGAIGEVYFAKAWYTNNRKSIGTGQKIPVPATLDFNLWQGPAPRKDFQSNLVHYNWHWFWNWGTGEAGNNGTHEIDCCRWMLGVDFPTKVTSAGGRYAFRDDWQTPDTQVAAFEFGDNKAITWEGRSCAHYPINDGERGFTIYGKNGTLENHAGGDYKIYDVDNKMIKEVKSNTAADPTNPVSATGDLDIFHFENFVNSIRGDARLNSPVDEMYKSVLLCQLANISQRTGHALHCDPKNGHILEDTAAAALWHREYEKGWEPAV